MNTSCTMCRMRSHCFEHGPDLLPIGRLGEILDRDILDGSHWFDKALLDESFSFHFQPIVDVRRERVHGHECLVRLQAADRLYSGGEILNAAIERRHVHVFDSSCRLKAIEAAAPHARPGTKVFINFFPSAIYDVARCLQPTLSALQRTSLRPSDVVFEVVDSEHIHRLPRLAAIRDFFRDHGFGFALDNVGTGQNTLTMVKQFRPEYIKMDVTGADFEAVAKLREVATWWGTQIIAGRVEEPSQADALQQAGIDLMQGWLFGKPAPEMVNCAAAFALRAA